MIREAIAKVVDGHHLTESEARLAMDDIMSGEATDSQIAAFITALRIKRETVDEIVGCAQTMRAKAEQIHPRAELIVDTCGTGGDGAKTFNISTAAAIVVAGAGCTVAKHGNRSVSSQCGSADILEAFGVQVDLPPADVEQCIEEVGIGFMYAPFFHGAMKHANGPRKEVGIRTVFNILGPLTNPAGTHAQVVGVYDASLTAVMAEVLYRLGVKKAWAVHGLDCVDEISISAPTQVSRVVDGKVETFTIAPEDYGFQRADRSQIAGGDVEENSALVASVLAGDKGAHRDVVLLNAAATLYVSEKADSFQDAVKLAAHTIDSGHARAKLDALRDFTRSCSKIDIGSYRKAQAN